MNGAAWTRNQLTVRSSMGRISTPSRSANADSLLNSSRMPRRTSLLCFRVGIAEVPVREIANLDPEAHILVRYPSKGESNE